MKNSEFIFGLILFIGLCIFAVPALILLMGVFSTMASSGSIIGWGGMFILIGFAGAFVCTVFNC